MLAAGERRGPLLHHNKASFGVRHHIKREMKRAISPECVQPHARLQMLALQVADQRQVQSGNQQVRCELANISDGLSSLRETDRNEQSYIPPLKAD